MNQHPQGDFIQSDFFDNTGGLNLTDSPFRVMETQAVGGYNYDYTATGGIQKRKGNTKASSTPDAQLKSLGIGLYASSTGTRVILRAAGTKIQSINQSTYVSTNLTEDTAAVNSNFLNASSTQQAVMSQFNTPASSVLWLTGAGSSTIYGYNGTKITKNGSAPAQGSITATPSLLGGNFAAIGTYWYAVVLHKASTGAVSNAALDASATIANVTDQVTIDLTTITSLDTTKYDQIYIYRSGTDGVTGFTTGDLIAQLPSASTSYIDSGSFIATAVNVPREGNIVLDNSVLPAGTITAMTVFKRRLVCAIGSTIYFSDLNKSESWPIGNTIDVPSGGPITGLSIISFSTSTTTSTDEFLVIFKERELWIVTGSSVEDWALKFIDFTGCPNQTLAVYANGFLSWMDYRGVYLWDGSAKPIYCSRPIEQFFSPDGDLDRSKLVLGVGTFFRKQNEIVWYLSSSIIGEQLISLKMDLRLTLPQVEQSIGGRILEGVFILDSFQDPNTPIYAASSLNPTFDEILLSGDSSGHLYRMFDNSTGDGNTGVAFSYKTKILDLGRISQTKRISKIIVWCRDTTSANLTLNYWMTYKTDAGSQATMAQPISNGVTVGLWDLANWDTAYWDEILVTYTPVVFNLNSPQASTEGEGLTIEFVQEDLNAPVTIAGFSVIYALGGLRK